MRRLFLIAIALPALMLAQGGRGFPGGLGQWWENPLANGLNLTEAQNKQIRSIVAEYRSRLIDLRANEQKAQGELQDIFNDTPNDQKRSSEVIERLGTARGETTKTISQMSLRLRNVLTNEQWQQLREREENRPRRSFRPPVDSKNAPDPGTRRRFGPPGAPAPDPNAPQPVKPPQH